MVINYCFLAEIESLAMLNMLKHIVGEDFKTIINFDFSTNLENMQKLY